ncbi:MAG: flagellar biosynthesis protein FlgB [Caulobacteraceae bacterium]|nr:flagellar biosynthesis protein FlgB [Caulobacteraceae bacterium]
MMLDDIPLFSMLKGRLSYLNQREQLIAQNVANSDTPGFTPHDLKPFTIASDRGPTLSMSLAPVQTSAAHLAGTAPSAPQGGAFGPQAAPDSETSLNGNKVVLEEEMMKMADARLNYDTALGLYQKSLSMIQLAIKAPGKS